MNTTQTNNTEQKESRVKKCQELSNELTRLTFDLDDSETKKYIYKDLSTLLTYMNHLENYGNTKNITHALSRTAKDLHEILKQFRKEEVKEI